MESYIIYQAKRYNVKGKQYLKTLEKYYVVDIGMRYMLLGSRSTDGINYNDLHRLILMGSNRLLEFWLSLYLVCH